MIRKFLLALLVVFLAACTGGGDSNAPVQSSQPAKIEPVTELTEGQKQSVLPTKPAAAIIPEPTIPLNLTLPSELFDGSEHSWDGEQSPMNDVFEINAQNEKRKKEKPLSLSASPLFKPATDDTKVPKIDGATVDVEYKFK